ncbi:potassium-transporting ATPase subunit C [Burkholderia ubonensis]|nr:potassium-transporting ATPase subunit C [Burkholderia ubonensis]KWB28985.1 potassium-transporting ATPase subunit C [Burkholderia ubonensis]KWC32264.1 potassium-transporting ATPase subunit C [Burkholderia ubonensis]KWI96066.1 potassium-transporting ATPase subunit C [Burkholderia ubonensis]KWK49607.1 potassium-transporting ATPase subunit C [Burkholderia ubonensis]
MAAAGGLVRPVIASSVLFMLVTGLAYPLLTTGVANVLFPSQARGSLVVRDGVTVGSAVIGQLFARPEYFHPRPSATVGTDPADPAKTVDQPYNAAGSGASNQGAASKKLLADIAARVRAYRQENGLAPDAPVPVDAVTASASGLDPEISIANARLQAARVAKARGVAPDQVTALVERVAAPRQLAVLGEPRVRVLELNMALDRALGKAAGAR